MWHVNSVMYVNYITLLRAGLIFVGVLYEPHLQQKEVQPYSECTEHVSSRIMFDFYLDA